MLHPPYLSVLTSTCPTVCALDSNCTLSNYHQNGTCYLYNQDPTLFNIQPNTPDPDWVVTVERLNRRSIDKTLISQEFTGSNKFLVSEVTPTLSEFSVQDLKLDIQSYVNRTLYTGPSTSYTLTFQFLWSPLTKKTLCASSIPLTLLTFTPGCIKGTPTIILNPGGSNCDKVFMTSKTIQTRDTKNEVEGFISQMGFKDGWNVIQVSYDNEVLIGHLNNQKIGEMSFKPFIEPDFGRDVYLKINAEGVVVKNLVFTQGWSRININPEVEEIEEIIIDDPVYLNTLISEYIKGNISLPEFRRLLNLMIIEKEGERDREVIGIIQSFLTYTGDFGDDFVPYYLTNTGEEKYTNLYSGVCSTSLGYLKSVAEKSFQELSRGNSKPIPSSSIKDLGTSFGKVDYFKGEGERGNLWLAQGFYWGNEEVQQDFGEARRHFELAAQEGGAPHIRGEALYNLGVMHANGQIPQQPNLGGDIQALNMWERGAGLGDLNCMAGLGGFYLRGGKLSNGTVLEGNGTKALGMYERARKGGSVEAEEMLGKGWVWGWWGKVDFKKGLVHLAVCAGRDKDGCLLELGRGIGEKDGWVARMGREIDKSAGEVKELDGFEVFQSNGRRYINVNGFEVPLGYDCYVARRYLLAVATRGPWVHEALEEGIDKYLDGNDSEALFHWSKCALMGATACAELAFEIMDGVTTEGGVIGGTAFFKDEENEDGLEMARMESWRMALRLKMANDDHARSVGWLGDCYWGGVANAVGCDVNRTTAMRLYEEGTLLFDDRSTWNEGLGWFFGDEKGGVVRNVTKGKEKLMILYEEKQPGWFAAGLALSGIEVWLWVEEWWGWWVGGDEGGQDGSDEL
ncbi:hypothetical protein TL16_g04695 [Triparma laevis f. inornata]|uniref:Uncharacterized protein n=1 Tax=Triparma laevis f. inornata TaxID=1714386 RepID=A0A9W7E6M6_9STRA|nr:hypothetical protein TL16_g04695 [Triparma laevis f. inornata]